MVFLTSRPSTQTIKSRCLSILLFAFTSSTEFDFVLMPLQIFSAFFYAIMDLNNISAFVQEYYFVLQNKGPVSAVWLTFTAKQSEPSVYEAQQTRTGF